MNRRILVLDGAMGTMIQREGLSESDFRGRHYADSSVSLKGCNDLLCLTRPEIISNIHRQYIEAGADIIETNSFNANSLSLREYHLEHEAPIISEAAARLARAEADAEFARSGRKVLVAGSMGPGNVALSMPAEPGKKAVTFDEMAEAYRDQALALMRGGADILLLETIFDTLNAKAAIYGIKQAFEETGKGLPLMLSMTLTESGRTLSGQTLEAFLAATRHAGAFSVGLNCGFGAEGMRPYLEALQDADCLVSIHPNAGLPDALGRYTETAEKMGRTMEEYMAKGWLNIAGGCCGTTPEHIRIIAEAAKKYPPRKIAQRDKDTLEVAGLEKVDVAPSEGFVKVGERCNVAGSRKFLRLINEGKRGEALTIAASQLQKGAKILDINMDDGMLDTLPEMREFVTLLGLDGSTAAAPLMIDSSRQDVIVETLKHIQGRPIVNSISLKEGEEKFLEHAREIRNIGGAVVVMAFDEEGQATTYERKIAICERAYKLLTEKVGFEGTDIIFDPNILTVATGIAEHDRYALDFLDAVSWIKRNLPGAKVSGGVSNLSFAFRGNNPLREAMHTVFLHHAIERGMDIAIVNPSTSLDIESVEPHLREAIEDLYFLRRPDATDRLLEILDATLAQSDEEQRSPKATLAQSGKEPRSPEATLAQSGKEQPDLAALVVSGLAENIESTLEEALAATGSAMSVIKDHLMVGMERVGEAFGAGRMFLPQVVRSAGVMKQAIAWLTPHIERENSQMPESAGGKMVLATVKGDVHDIGKNIVSVVLRCSGIEVHDLGVMVEGKDIIAKAKEIGADFIGLSGLITPSLSEMADIAAQMEREGMQDVVLFVGGATTSPLHTAMKIAPVFSGLTVHTRDASMLPTVATALRDPERRDAVAAEIRAEQERLRREFEAKQSSSAASVTDAVPLFEAVTESAPHPRRFGITNFEFAPSELVDLINWKAFYHVWKLPASGEESAAERERLHRDALALIERLDRLDIRIHARVNMLEAHRRGDDIVISLGAEELVIPTPRRVMSERVALADFLSPAHDWIGLFAVTVGERVGRMIHDLQRGDDYESLLLQSVADRLAEAATELLHRRVNEEVWGLPEEKWSIRPAIGYPSLPDQMLVHKVDAALRYHELGIKLTVNGALWPSATTTGLIFGTSRARY